MRMHAMTSMKNLLSGNSADSPSPVQNGDVHIENARHKSDKKQMNVHAISNGHMQSEPYTYTFQTDNVQGSSYPNARTSNNTEITSLDSPQNSKGGTATPGQVEVENVQNQSENNNTEVCTE